MVNPRVIYDLRGVVAIADIDTLAPISSGEPIVVDIVVLDDVVVAWPVVDNDAFLVLVINFQVIVDIVSTSVLVDTPDLSGWGVTSDPKTGDGPVTGLHPEICIDNGGLGSAQNDAIGASAVTTVDVKALAVIVIARRESDLVTRLGDSDRRTQLGCGGNLH
jgi:hypothetical protein